MKQEPLSLESEVCTFATNLPYWGQYLCKKMFAGSTVTDTDIDTAYGFLLEDLDLRDKSIRPAISFAMATSQSSNFRKDLIFSKLENLEGVNALCENQIIEFSPHLTILFGANGAGKSGYIRLLKKAFYSKSPEDIHPNVYSSSTSKQVKADFSFTAGTASYVLNYPSDINTPEFRQFAVFDGKSVLKHLENKNQFEFRPAGLSFFSALTDAIKKLESKLNTDIAAKPTSNYFTDLFEGNSEIKVLISSLSGNTKMAVLDRYLPFTDTDIKQKQETQRKYDEIVLSSRNKQKELESLQMLQQLLEKNKLSAIALNRFFSEEHLTKTRNAITECIEKEEKAKKNGIDNFAHDNVENIGTAEWRGFIVAAEKFARQQSGDYPGNEDNCLLCHQPLTKEAQDLISKYWTFLKSLSEKEAKESQEILEKGKLSFEKLNFALFPPNNTLTDWISDNFPEIFAQLNRELVDLEKLATDIVSHLETKTKDWDVISLQITLTDYLEMEKHIINKISVLKDNKFDPEFEALGYALTLLVHREKLALHIDKITQYTNDQRWILKAGKVNWSKRSITESEKNLSAKFFNQKYIDTFNQECTNMNGNFGITINHTGAGGTSYRQLFIEGKNPATVLSEGEQKVIALADFIAEMTLSDVNRGIFFDDPVTSLDHERKEVIAKHLVEIASTKQVIIFTHDIFFLLSLKWHAESIKVPLQSCSLYKNDDLVGITKSSLPWIASNVKDRCGYLTNELQRITKLHKTADPDTYRFEVKSWCGLLREAWERSVEERLFKGVVSRFSYGVETQKMKYLSVTEELITCINDGMTRTSKWVHDQASGQNTPTPKPDQLQEMIGEFDEFIKVKCKAQ